jgi:putative ABC transport system ATP-binding protein
MTALELINVTHRYGDVDALSEVSLTVARGELVALVGPSGSGKSTLLAIAGALLTPTSGRVLVNGTEISGASEKERTQVRRNDLGFIFQTSNLLGFLDVADNVLAPEVLRSKGRAQAREGAAVLLAELGLEHKAGSRTDALSGGERQRVGIARALIGQPSLVLADEPTASLDGQRGRSVVELLCNEVHQRKVGAVLVTHDERVLDLVDRVVRIEDGRILSGSTQPLSA